MSSYVPDDRPQFDPEHPNLPVAIPCAQDGGSVQVARSAEEQARLVLLTKAPYGSVAMLSLDVEDAWRLGQQLLWMAANHPQGGVPTVAARSAWCAVDAAAEAAGVDREVARELDAKLVHLGYTLVRVADEGVMV